MTPSRPEKWRRWSLYPQRQLAPTWDVVQWTSPDGLSCLGDVAALRSGTARRSALASRTSYLHRFGPSGRLRGGGLVVVACVNVAFASRIPRPLANRHSSANAARKDGVSQPPSWLTRIIHTQITQKYTAAGCEAALPTREFATSALSSALLWAYGPRRNRHQHQPHEHGLTGAVYAVHAVHACVQRTGWTRGSHWWENHVGVLRLGRVAPRG